MMATSWAPEVFVQGQWSRNHVRLPTKDQARGYALNLMLRWTLVEEIRVVESDDPVNHLWENDGLTEVNE